MAPVGPQSTEHWSRDRWHGDAGAFHHHETEDRLQVWQFTADRSSLVLGSAQVEASVDRAAASAADIEVVRRRSGGGGVLLVPGEFVWIDVVIPADDRRWRADVGEAMWWIGEAWCTALQQIGVEGVVHRGPMIRTPWSSAVCFSGLGAGEVTMAGSTSKLVGIAQRRTRQWARFQSMCHLRWRPDLHASLVSAVGARPAPTADDIADAAAVVAADQFELAELVIQAITAPS